jgi:hypothetical protein
MARFILTCGLILYASFYSLFLAVQWLLALLY